MTKTTRLFLAMAILALAAIPLLSKPVAADTNTGTSGQPSQSCQAFFSGALSPQGFNTAGFAIADIHYAGNGQTLLTPANQAVAISQYDVACFQAAQR